MLSFSLRQKSFTGTACHSQKLTVVALRLGWESCQRDKRSRKNEVSNPPSDSCALRKHFNFLCDLAEYDFFIRAELACV